MPGPGLARVGRCSPEPRIRWFSLDPNAILAGLRNETLDRSAVTEPDLLAVIDFADWLSFPTELGRYLKLIHPEAAPGRRQEGVDLLTGCLALLDKDAESAKGSDVDLFANRRKAHVEALESIY